MSSRRRQSQSRPRSHGRSTSSSLPVVSELDEENSTQATAKSTGSALSLENGAAAGANPTDLSGTTKKQRALLKGTKLLVFVSLMVGALGFAIATYVFARTGESNAFQRQMYDHGTEIIEVSQSTARNALATITGMSVTITSHVLDKNEELGNSTVTWPFVTVPHFESRIESVIDLSGAKSLAFSPLVKTELREQWESYSYYHQGWIPRPAEGEEEPAGIYPRIHSYSEDFALEVETTPSYNNFYAPLWQISTLNPQFINLNLLYLPEVFTVFTEMLETKTAVLSGIANIPDEADVTDESSWPSSYLAVPIFDALEDDEDETAELGADIVGFLTAVLPWHNFFANVLPPSAPPVLVVVENTCGQSLSYEVSGPNVTYLGSGDLHNSEFDFVETSAPFDDLDSDRLSYVDEKTSKVQKEHCFYSVQVFPTQEFYDSFFTGRPIIYTVSVLFIFFLTSIVFIMYDVLVSRHQEAVKESAERSNAIISSLFPAQVRDRLLAGGSADAAETKSSFASPLVQTNNMSGGKKRGEEEENAPGTELLNSRPIADLFANCTVLFADIAGFTAWSSVREPPQVFMLLEQIYSSFDHIAQKRKIFKVETIGDCYVAVAGLPEPRKDHAVVMSLFAYECRGIVNPLVKKLEVVLGPGTSELAMRFGLHSGPVTAGVLRGEKSRFQLFGDTVNTASRIETTSERDKIHLSQDTANHLIEAGKKDWITPREGTVTAKGKGVMKTYWLTMTSKYEKYLAKNGEKPPAGLPSDANSGSEGKQTKQQREERLIDWLADVLYKNLQKIEAMRAADRQVVHDWSRLRHVAKKGTTVLDEVKDVINLSPEIHEYKQDPNSIDLSDKVYEQLRDYVSKIADLYRENPFHSFEHASHVTQSVTKLLSRVVTPDVDVQEDDIGDMLHQYTYGITSDPLIQFSCAFSALIHDADHPGVPNAQLVKEHTSSAKLYKNKSVAEQNSVDLAWELLVEPRYAELRQCIYTNQEELDRFRQLVVNSVMATDITDKELGALRKKRWAKAFADEPVNVEKVGHSKTAKHHLIRRDQNRKATIVIEHIIQASDVSHTMQHWHVYIKWNEKFFHENYRSYLAGRAEKDPSEGWYEGEIGFFDFYVIPLAKKLKECGVFGVSSDEYLNYALANRLEWKMKGQEVLKGYLEKYKNKGKGSLASGRS